MTAFTADTITAVTGSYLHDDNEQLPQEALSQYYSKNFFSTTDTVFYTEQASGHYGMAGDPVPYTIRGDNFITAVLLLCFAAIVISVSHTRRFIVRQTKFFFHPSYNDLNINETTGEVHFQLFLVGLWCMLMAITTYLYATQFVADTFVVNDETSLVIIFFSVFMGFQLFRVALYMLVNHVFFTSIQNKLWMKEQLFITAAEGVFIFPAVLLLVYFDLSLINISYYLIFIFILSKILTIYKCWSIFFRQNDVFLQTFLYFCTLEIVPLLGLASGTLVLIDNLRLNF